MKLKYFTINKIPKVSDDYTCLAVINVDSALKKDQKYYPQAFSKECKYIKREVIF